MGRVGFLYRWGILAALTFIPMASIAGDPETIRLRDYFPLQEGNTWHYSALGQDTSHDDDFQWTVMNSTVVGQEAGTAEIHTATEDVLPGIDDHGNSATSATLIAVDTPVFGIIEVDGDADWFRFTANEGVEYTIETTLNSLDDSILTLIDRDGVSELAFDDDGGFDLASRIVWTCPASGDYFIVVGGFGDSTGSYGVEASGASGPSLSLLPPPNIDFGQRHGDIDHWRISPTGELQLTAVTNGYPDEYDATIFGMWTVLTFPAQTMPLSEPITVGGDNLSIGGITRSTGSTSAQIEVTTPTFLMGTKTVSATIEVTTECAGFVDHVDTVMGRFNNVLKLRIGVAGHFSIEGLGLSFPFSIRQTEAFLKEGVGMVAFVQGADDNESQAQTLASGVVAGNPVVADAAGQVLGELGQDFDGDGVSDRIELGAANNGDGNDDGILDVIQTQVISLPSPVNGEYVTIAAGTDTAIWQVRLRSYPVADSVGLQFPFGFLECYIYYEGVEEDDEDWFRFSAIEGVQYTMETTLLSLDDSVLALFDTDGASELAENDDGGLGLASRIVWTCPVSGDYYVVVTGYEDSTGDYELALSAATTGDVGDLKRTIQEATSGAGMDDHGDDAAGATVLPVNTIASGAIRAFGGPPRLVHVYYAGSSDALSGARFFIVNPTDEVLQATSEKIEMITGRNDVQDFTDNGSVGAIVDQGGKSVELRYRRGEAGLDEIGNSTRVLAGGLAVPLNSTDQWLLYH